MGSTRGGQAARAPRARRVSRIGVLVASVTIVLQLAAIQPAFAATHTWSGAADNNWSNAGNWSGGSPSGDPTAAVMFPSSGVTRFASNNNLSSPTPISSMTFAQGGFTLSGNTIAVSSGVTNSAGSNSIIAPLSLSGTGAFNVANTGDTLTIGSTISGTGSLTKSGNGALLLQGASTYSGGTTINQGTVYVSGSMSSGVTENAGVLGGTGTVGSITSLGGVVAPGIGGAGQLNAGNNVTLNGSTLNTELNGVAAGSGYDVLHAGGVVSLLNSPTLNVTAGFTPTPGTQFVIVSAGAPIVNTFNGLPENALISIGGVPYRINYNTVVANAVTLRRIDTTTTALASDINPSMSGQTITLTATVTRGTAGASPRPTGTVTFKDGANVLGTTAVNQATGGATLLVNTLAVGSHSLTAAYSADSNYGPSTSPTLSQIVNQGSSDTSVSPAPSSPSAFGQSVTFTATVTAHAPAAGVPTGSVTFKDGATTIGTGTLDGSGHASMSTATLSVGSHSIAAVYGGDANFTTSSSSPLPYTVNKATTTTSLTSSVNPSVFGQSVKFTATVTAPAPAQQTGTVTFLDGVTTLGTGTLNSSGVATFSMSALAPGSHSITASYGGDGNYASSTSSVLTQTVNKANTVTSVTSSTNPSVFGQPVTYTATVVPVAPGQGNPSGTVTFKDGANSLGTGSVNGSGVATLTTSATPTGSRSITAVYGGDSNFNTSGSGIITQTVNKAQTSTVVDSSLNPSGIGNTVTLSATVTAVAPGAGTPTGTVQFKDGGANLGAPAALNGSGVAQLTTSSLAVGNHAITAVYAGDTNFATSTSAVFNQVVNSNSSTVLSSSLNPSVYGQSVTFTATVSAISPAGTPTGTVTFSIDGSTVASNVPLDGAGKATYSTSALSVGSHTVDAVYSGDGTYGTSTAATLTQVVKPNSVVAVSTSPNPSVFGQDVTISVTVTAVSPAVGTPTGTVTFKDSGTTIGGPVTLVSGSATMHKANLTAGTHVITVDYSGDGTFTPNTSDPYSHVVNPAATSTALASSANPSVKGQTVTFTATVTTSAPGVGTPTGTVTFKDGTGSLGAPVALNGSGKAMLATSALDVGAHSITATFDGSSNFATSTSSPLSQTVNSNSATALASSTNPAVSGQNVTFTATVTAVAPITGTPTGTVTFKDGAVTLGTSALNGSGHATLSTAALAVGGHSIVATYNGDPTFTTSASSPLSETVNKANTNSAVGTSHTPSVFGESVTFTATVSATSPGTGTPTGDVTFFDGATTLATRALASGQATFSTSELSVGAHSITVTYNGDPSFNTSNSSSITQTVNQATTGTQLVTSSNPSVFGQSVTFTATVTPNSPASGSPSGTVTFNDGATSIGSSTVDATGTASLTTSALTVGSHSISAVYDGDTNFATSTSNTVTQTVNQAATSTALVSSSNPSSLGSPVTFTATISPVAPGAGTATGTVTFKDGVTTIGSAPVDASAHAALTTSSLGLGTHNISAVYGGDGNFTGSTSNTVSQVVNNTPATGGYELDYSGGLHPYALAGNAMPPAATSGPYWPGQNVTRGVAEFTAGSSGYILDLSGGIHPFTAGAASPPPATSGGSYWPGQDVVRGIAILPNGTGGYVADLYGGLHPFRIGAGATPPAATGGPYWPGQDAVRGVAILPDGSGGYVLDAYGGLHPFRIGAGAPPPATSGGSYWPGQDVVRGVTILPDGSGGYVADLYGGLHPFRIGAGATPPATSGGPYWPGQDAVRGVAVARWR